ncbi:Pyridoxal phosphate homeostasis protein like protein [Aduncisulcus paluster]|uniref:Pyridoxal phosphate homeostasis protein n=1 Tax=Aduncisulcus paluster TaxID=2918883 RepID=A0ABQ5KVC4_9EUKA|nr:Pyridoxal phosphate homeostasis protein like protein [Aduncisulcus paluster]
MEAAVIENLHDICKSIEIENKKYDKHCELIAVSKTKPNSLIEAAYSAGHRAFGENYAQELQRKAAELPSDIQWHYIGHLQKSNINKIIKIPNLFCIHTIDSVEITADIVKRIPKERESPINVMIQVNTSLETSKSGVSTNEEAIEIAKYILSCEKLNLFGFMTIGHPLKPEEGFVKLVETKETVCASLKLDPRLLKLSMGMSGDYKEAIQHGSDYVRVGSSIFGARDYSKK